VSAAEKVKAESLINRIRRDTRFVPPGQRMSSIEALAYVATLSRLRRQAYDSKTILKKPRFAVADLAFNCILIRANEQLKVISKAIAKPLPEELQENMASTSKSLEILWDEQSGSFTILILRVSNLSQSPAYPACCRYTPEQYPRKEPLK